MISGKTVKESRFGREFRYQPMRMFVYSGDHIEVRVFLRHGRTETRVKFYYNLKENKTHC